MASNSADTTARSSLRAVFAKHLAAALCAGLATACGPGTPAAQVSDTAQAFLAEQRGGAWAAAFARLHPGMQQRCGSPWRLRHRVNAAAAIPEQWQLRVPNVGRYTALIVGEQRNADGVAASLQLAFDRTDAGWAITAWSTNQQELC